MKQTFKQTLRWMPGAALLLGLSLLAASCGGGMELGLPEDFSALDPAAQTDYAASRDVSAVADTGILESLCSYPWPRHERLS